jgi:hypothetical protein
MPGGFAELWRMRSLPDPDLSLRDASDFIFESAICRRALLRPDPVSLAVFVRDLVSSIYRLTISCHLAEFTDHGLHHLCSLVDRISRWTTQQGGIRSSLVIDGFDPSECAVLLLATLLHDIGMLSQRPEDMPQQQSQSESKGVSSIPDWVRTTHIDRMESLTRRLFPPGEHMDVIDSAVLDRAFTVARAHGEWPLHWGYLPFAGRDAGLAAILAVADLLDEDSNRCDIGTLLRHRQGSHLNCAHWIRHGLTGTRVLVQDGVIAVALRRPPDTDAQLAPAYRALRNHYTLCFRYLDQLAQVNAGLIRITFDPEDGCPETVAMELQDWNQLAGFRTQSAFLYHLLNSFMPEAILDSRRVSPSDVVQLRSLGLQDIDLTEFQRIRGRLELHSMDEQAFQAIVGPR